MWSLSANEDFNATTFILNCAYFCFMEIKGVVVSGVGEGKWYVEKYLPYFEQTLGFTCFPGTLNMKVSKALDLEKGGSAFLW